MASAPGIDSPRPATEDFLKTMGIDDLVAWRVADVSDRPAPEERNLRDEFAMGWYAVCYSDELAVGQVKRARYFGTDLVVWRGEDGAPRVLDAYCAHYGANLSVGGKVSGNLIECPFHAWRFNGDGACEEIPYARVIPPQARKANCVPAWPTREANNLVLVWYHPERKAPIWDPLDVPETRNAEWTPYQKFAWRIFTSMENMGDNGVDVAHFQFVHGSTSVPTYTYEFDGIERRVSAHLDIQTPKGDAKATIVSCSHGPGQGSVRFTGLSETVLVSATTPVELDEIHVRFGFIQPKAQAEGKGANLAKALLRDLCKQLDQDKIILDRHRVMNPPLICDGDGPFGRNREWNKQFYLSTNPESRFDPAKL
jgi:phenylpropionate dioxygenase-like ring-hydroxylating dioxygenase large terminal subunit